MSGHKDPGDAWVVAADGVRCWGRFGAAGLLAFDRQLGAILLQHRVSWSDHGDTWGIPGGALHQHESAISGAIREAQEEAGVPDSAVTPRYTHLLDRGGWSYTTVVAEVANAFTPVITDPESHALAWVPLNEVARLPLHPAFSESWTLLQPLLSRTPTVVIDAANVVGAVPDGWWKDRRGATARLRDRVEAASLRGTRPGFFDLPPRLGVKRVFPTWHFITESTARGIDSTPHVQIVDAPHSGDDAIVAEVKTLAETNALCTVVTSDAELKIRCQAAGASATRAAHKFLRFLEQAEEN